MQQQFCQYNNSWDHKKRDVGVDRVLSTYNSQTIVVLERESRAIINSEHWLCGIYLSVLQSVGLLLVCLGRPRSSGEVESE